MKNWKANMLAITVGVISVILFVLGIWWLLWKLWLFVVPQFWPAGPEALIHPDSLCLFRLSPSPKNFPLEYTVSHRTVRKSAALSPATLCVKLSLLNGWYPV